MEKCIKLGRLAVGSLQQSRYNVLPLYGKSYFGALSQIMEVILDKEEDIRAEMNVFQNHSAHRNIVSFLGAYLYKDQQVDEQLWIVMEVCVM